MIIWINGAFGSGKTQAAYELHGRIADSYVYDPERIGFFLNKNIPKQIRKYDFQDYPLWRQINYSLLKQIAAEYNGVIIVPMTVVIPRVFDEIVGRLRDDGLPVRHFVLWASRETLLKRLKSRGDFKNSWGAQHIDRCMEGLSDAAFLPRLDTDTLSVEQVAEQIAQMCGLELAPDNSGKLAKKIKRVVTQLKHIRYFI
ncbi:tunicamycin resistance protein [Paenibacillus hemerocallicola]|uniref:Tunicamycin resistance protein n=1 Tax=Paenibacillus hemerocallicola TaxID=1172614 RepID=A0A5C4T460_9BACL|nr:AAA family ATPase [Paenibacillus hemerocallicola]TNJ63872.1 tunicamycin resistance protein [Paenibacillus hemerocallicola]